MTYLVDNHKYEISYQELRELYHEFKEMDDKEFLLNLPRVLHFSCIISFFKELPTYLVLGDRGIIHEIAHLLNPDTASGVNLEELRTDFNTLFKLD